jgi:monoterpene epsilon-lactone hydrolase
MNTEEFFTAMTSGRGATLTPQQVVDGVRSATEGLAKPILPAHVIRPTVVGGVPCEWVIADGVPDDAPVVQYMHGGALISGAPRHFRACTVGVSGGAQARVLAVDYRLAPEHAFPAAFEDCLSVYRELASSHDPARLVVAGDSVGACLTIGVLADARDAGLPQPSCAIANSPYCDFMMASPSLDDPERNRTWVNRDLIVKLNAAYLGDSGADPRDPRHSPVYRDLTGIAPLLIQIAGKDNSHDDAIRLAGQARSCGVPVAVTDYLDAEHVWIATWAPSGDAPEVLPAQAEMAHKAFREIGEFVSGHVS